MNDSLVFAGNAVQGELCIVNELSHVFGEVRMKKALLVSVCLAVAACGQLDQREQLMAGGGALVGGLIGYQFGGGWGSYIMAGLGAAAGGLTGLTVARNLSPADHSFFNRSGSQALNFAPVGQTSSWSNPQNGHNGTFTPNRAFTANTGQNCKEFTATVNGPKGFVIERLTACLQSDGSWQVVGA